MGFYRKYNTILKTIDNVVKLYKITKKDSKKQKMIKNEDYLFKRF